MRRLLPAFALAAAALAALPAGVAEPAAPRPDTLVVALDLAGRPFQAGSVRGSLAVFATGFEVELARALARGLGYERVRLIHVPRERILAPGPKRWSVALARLQPGSTRALSFSAPYLEADQAVVLRRGLPRPRGLAGLRRLQLCAERGSRSADVVARIRPALRPLLAADETLLARRLQTGLCDAGVVEAPLVGRFVASRKSRFGPVAGRIRTEAAYAAGVERGDPLRAELDAALRRLAADGTLARLRRVWLGGDPAELPVLR